MCYPKAQLGKISASDELASARSDMTAAQKYRAEEDGPLAANWVLLWLTPRSQSDVRRPILLVFERNPDSIISEPGVTKITLLPGSQQVVAVLPWAVSGLAKTNTMLITSAGLLIVVGVVLDTMRQLEAQLLMRRYEGFLRR